MEQTVNQFSKGLLMDSHPMVQSNDTLSDALNATFITMNGNEVILQNDMGNRRVDNAYLPAGYEPVGIKEYGGIIYIAAYNPITNKSLIGSFPSPERKIGVLDDNSLNGSFFETELMNCYNEKNLNNLVCLTSDVVQVPITGKNSLHAGDKFVLYSDDLNSSLSNNLSNFNNVSAAEKKVISPKNKKYTISIGILNSLNEFVDITKTLARYDNDSSTPYKFDKDVSDLYKFNYGYFICKAFDNSEMTLTVRDAEFIKERNTLPCNTYAYKLVGPMYMQTKLNHIDTFNYNIYGSYNNGNVDLYIEGTATYNCPDGVSNTLDENIDSDIYCTYETGEVSDFMFDFFKCEQGGSFNTGNILTIQNSNDKQSLYDPVSNTYSVKYVKHLTFSTMSSTFDYVIGVKSGLTNNGTIYLAGLSDKGTIDLNLLGSGAVTIKGWRFFNKNNSTTLTYTLLMYPEYGETIDYMEFHLRDVSSNSLDYIVISEQPAGNGRQTIIIDWEKEYPYGNVGRTSTLKEKTLYEVLIYYRVSTSEGSTMRQLLKDNNQAEQYFILTTSLFNSCYSPVSSNEDYIANYVYPGGTEGDFCGNITINTNNSSNNKEIEAFKKKILIVPKMDYFIEDKSEGIKSSIEGTFIKKTESYDSNNLPVSLHTQSVKYVQTKDINIELKANIQGSFDLYPEFISLNSIGSDGKYFVVSGVPLSNINEIKEYLKGKVDNPDNYISLTSALRVNGTGSVNKVLGEVCYKDIFTADYTPYFGEIKNTFDNIYNYIQDVFTLDNRKSKYISYSGIFTDSTARTGHHDKHYCYFIYEYGANKLGRTPKNIDKTTNEVEEIFYAKEDTSEELSHLVNFINNWKSSNPSYDLKSYFNRIPKKKVFAYLFGPDSTSMGLYNDSYNEVFVDRDLWVRDIRDNTIEDCNPIPANIANRVWWKTSDGEWAVIDKLFLATSNLELTDEAQREVNLSNDIRNQIIDIFGGRSIAERLFFCRYKRYQCKGQLLVPDVGSQTYNSPYSYDYKVQFQFKTNLNLNTNNVHNIFLNFGIDNTKSYESEWVKLFTVKSSESFLDIVLSNLYNDIDNIDIGTGIQVDSYGNKLLPSNIYYRREFLNSNLQMLLDNVFTMMIDPPFLTDTSGLDDENLLVCVAEHDKAVTSYPTQFTKDSNNYDSFTWFRLDKVERFSPEKFTNNFNNYTYNQIVAYPQNDYFPSVEEVPGVIEINP